ncbi:MAG: radical SAM protein [Pseudomonadota bacterium]
MKIFSAVKKQVFSIGKIGCVGEVTTLNVTRGCAGECVFCYARCYRGAPEPGTFVLYNNLPSQLRQELDSPRRKRPLPKFVVLSSYSDAFLGSEAVTQVTRNCLEILLNRRIGVSFSTRGIVPEEIVSVLGRHPKMVQVHIPITSLSAKYVENWEPGTALPKERLFLVQRLLRVGIVPSIRLDPIIPFVTDGTEQIREVVSAVVGLGLDRAQMSFLHLRPGVAEQLRKEAPMELRRIVLGSFPSERTGSGAPFDHIPVQQMTSSLRRIQRIAREHGLRISGCHCQNPGLPAGRCPILPEELPDQPGLQRSLFDGDNVPESS